MVKNFRNSIFCDFILLFDGISNRTFACNITNEILKFIDDLCPIAFLDLFAGKNC